MKTKDRQEANGADLPAHFAIEICSLLIEETGREFSIIKKQGQEYFLASSIGWNKRKNWTHNFRRAALFPGIAAAKHFAQPKFKKVLINL